MKTLRKGSGRLLGWLLTIVMACGLLLSNGISVKAEGSIDNNGYPNGKNMSSSTITLICEATGAQQYQWQVSDAKEGTYTDIPSATAAEYTFGPENLKWYRCVVDGTPNKAVQAVKPGEEGRTWTKYYSDSSSLSNWYLSNGKVAYFVCGDKFDIVGEYQKGNTTYMLCTSFNRFWQMYEGNGDSKKYSDYSSSAPQKIHFSFDDLAVNVSVELGSGTGNFAFGCDTQLGDDNTSGGYSDKAALVAALNGDNTLKHIAMVGADAVNDETDPNVPAFVIEPQGNPMFWIGLYSDRKVYDYNVNDGSVVTIVQDTDSGMTMSWKGESSVQFAFKVGTAKDTGAKKADSTVTTAPAAKTLTYNGQAQELVTAGTATGGEMQYALGTATEATQPYTTSIPTATNAGTYYVWYRVKGDLDHYDSEPRCVTVNISIVNVPPAPAPTAAPTDVPKTGDGANLVLWIGLILLGFLGIIAFAGMAGRKHRNR